MAERCSQPPRNRLNRASLNHDGFRTAIALANIVNSQENTSHLDGYDKPAGYFGRMPMREKSIAGRRFTCGTVNRSALRMRGSSTCTQFMR